MAKATRPEERRATQALGAAFRAVNVISVREQLEAAGDLFSRLALAIRGAGAVAALAGLLVLAGAIDRGGQGPGAGGGDAQGAGRRSRADPRGLWPGIRRGGPDRRDRRGGPGLRRRLAGRGPWSSSAHWSVDWTGVAALVAGAAAIAGAGGLVAASVALGKRPAPVLREG